MASAQPLLVPAACSKIVPAGHPFIVLTTLVLVVLAIALHLLLVPPMRLFDAPIDVVSLLSRCAYRLPR